MARYYQLPVGNLAMSVGDGASTLAPDAAASLVTLAADVHFTRALWAHNHCVWATRHARPDLGGKQMDDSRYVHVHNRVYTV
jgi:hypothetical protein